MKRYIFNYLPEFTRRGVVYRPVVLIYLKSREKEWFAFRAYVDSGADVSLFMRSDSEMLGLDLYDGEYRPIVGIGKILIPAYMHNVEARIGETIFKTSIAFADSDEAPRLLGRMDIFKHFKITFDEVNLQTIFEPCES
ncbi:MAG: hypothetical protein QW304_00030 [Thermoproteota archaeon]